MKDREELEVIYDSLAYRMSVNLYSLNKGSKSIDLYGYRPMDAEHQFVFSMALLNASLFNQSIRMDCGLLTRIKLSWKNRKKIKFIKKCKKPDGAKSIDDIVEFMRPTAIVETGNQCFNFGLLLNRDTNFERID